MNLAIADAYRRKGRPIGSLPKIGFVTAQLSVSYLKPAPIDKAVELSARIVKTEGRKSWVGCELRPDRELCAKGEVPGISVER